MHGTSLRVLMLILTPACNLRCAYCYQGRRGGGRMSVQTCRAAIDLLLRSTEEEVKIEFYGGEPLLAFGLLRQAVEYAEAVRPRSKRLRFGLSTNGTRLDAAGMAFLARHRVDTQLSFDGVPAAQDLRAPGTFRLLDRKLGELRRSEARFFREDLGVALTLVPQALPAFADSVDYFLEKDVRELNVAPADVPASEWQRESVPELERQFSRVFSSCLRHYRRTGRVPLTLFRKTTASRVPRREGPVCAAGDGSVLVVDVDGRATSCVVLAESCRTLPGPLERWASTFRIGKLADPELPCRLEEYRAAVRKTGLFERREDLYSSYGRCRDCPYRQTCFVCPVAFAEASDDGDPRRVPDFTCAFNRIALDLRARFPRQPDGRALFGILSPAPPAMRALLAEAASRSRLVEWVV
jgi:sulfatase maturation enzyme AslB (radical SAM superfamily)